MAVFSNEYEGGFTSGWQDIIMGKIRIEICETAGFPDENTCITRNPDEFEPHSHHLVWRYPLGTPAVIAILIARPVVGWFCDGLTD